MGLIGTARVGRAIGALAHWVMPGEPKRGWSLPPCLGGSMRAGFTGQGLGACLAGQVDPVDQ